MRGNNAVEENSSAIVWVSWETHTRNKTLAREFNAKLVQLDYVGSNQLARYFFSVISTIRLLWQWRRKIVIAQNPSMVLCLLCIMLRPFFRYKFVVDAHNAGVYPREGNTVVLQKLADFIIRNTSFVIVSNVGMAEAVKRKAGRPLILPDPLPQAHVGHRSLIPNSVLFICSWAEDEPFLEVFKAAQALPDIVFYVTGNSRGRELAYGERLPKNVKLTGYLPEVDYFDLLAACTVILDLTTRDHCLVCGAYEAVSYGKPFVLSNNKATRDYFKFGGLFCDNTAPDIAQCIKNILADNVQHSEDVLRLRGKLREEWPLLLRLADMEIKGY